MTKSELEQYREYVVAQLNELSPLLQSYALGDFSESIEIPEQEDEFTELFVGLSLMVDDIKEMIREREDTINRLRQAEAALRASEQRLSITLRSIGDAVIATDAQELVTLMNPIAEDLTGWNEAEAVGQPLEDVFHIINEQTGERVESPVVKVLREGVIVGLANHTALIAKDGTKRPIADSGAPMRDEGGSIIGTVLVFRDITESRQAQEALQESEDKYRSLVENAPDLIMNVDREGTIQFANRRPSVLAVDDVVGRHFLDFMPEEYHDMVQRIHKRVFETGKAESYETFGRVSGQWYSTHVGGVLREGETVGLTLITRNITDRKQVEESLRHQWERFLAMISNFPEVLYVVDPETYEVLFVNKVLAEALGSDPIGKLCYQAFQGFDAPCDFCTNEIILRERKPYTWEYHNPIINRDYLITDQIIRWPDGRDVRFEIAIDITERRRAEEALRERSEALERSNKELEQFAYIASHDLQEPLRMVSSYTQLLERRYKDQLDADAHDFIHFAVDGANRMQRLINDLLAYSRVGTRGKPFEKTYGEVVIDQALDNLRTAIEGSGAVITHDPLPTVMADEAQLLQLFQNLIGNAIKFRGDQLPQVHVGVERRGGEWQFSVHDNGIGIDPQYYERIFVIFQRLHSKEEYPGTGIGLAVCKKIVERHGGTIWVESQPGEGSTFYFTIPVISGQ